MKEFWENFDWISLFIFLTVMGGFALVYTEIKSENDLKKAAIEKGLVQKYDKGRLIWTLPDAK